MKVALNFQLFTLLGLFVLGNALEHGKHVLSVVVYSRALRVATCFSPLRLLCFQFQTPASVVLGN